MGVTVLQTTTPSVINSMDSTWEVHLLLFQGCKVYWIYPMPFGRSCGWYILENVSWGTDNQCSAVVEGNVLQVLGAMKYDRMQNLYLIMITLIFLLSGESIDYCKRGHKVSKYCFWYVYYFSSSHHVKCHTLEFYCLVHVCLKFAPFSW